MCHWKWLHPKARNITAKLFGVSIALGMQPDQIRVVIANAMPKNTESSEHHVAKDMKSVPPSKALPMLAIIGQGKLPISLSEWPAHAPSYLSNLDHMIISTASGSSVPMLSLSTT